jgi:hypothetical protein
MDICNFRTRNNQNKCKLDIESEFSLPDFFEKMEFINNDIKVRCLNDNQIILRGVI